MATITLTPERKDRLGRYLSEQLDRTVTGRTAREDVWREAIERYEAKSIQKNFPWKGASNIRIPIAAIMADTIHARIMNSLFAQDTPVAVEPLTEESISGVIDPITGEPMTWRTVSEKLEQYMLYETSPAGEVKWYDFVREFTWEMIYLGTSIGKASWFSERRRDITTLGTRVDHTVADNFRPEVIPLENVFVPPFYPSMERIPWITQRYLIRPSEALQRIDSHEWNGSVVREWLKGAADAEVTPLQEEQQLVEGTGDPLEYGTEEKWVAETWVSFDFDGTGREVRLLVDHDWEDPSTIFRVIPWPYEHGRLPFVKANYIERRKSFYGIGVPERVAELEDAISDNSNMVADNIIAANTRLFKVRSGSRAMRELDTIWPMKKLACEQMDDIEPFQLGEVYPSAFEFGNILRDYVERLSKVSDYNLGRESTAMGKQGTATATMALLQESGQYFDAITRSERSALNEILQQWVDLLSQTKPLERVRAVLGQYAEPVLAALSLPYGDLRKRIAVRCAFSSTAATRELARQEELQKMQLLDQHYNSLIQYATMRMQQPMFAPLVDAIAKDRQYHMDRVMEAHGEGRTPTTIPPWNALVQQMTMGGMNAGGMGPVGGQSPMGSVPGGTGGAQGAPPAGPPPEGEGWGGGGEGGGPPA